MKRSDFAWNSFSTVFSEFQYFALYIVYHPPTPNANHVTIRAIPTYQVNKDTSTCLSLFLVFVFV